MVMRVSRVLRAVIYVSMLSPLGAACTLSDELGIFCKILDAPLAMGNLRRGSSLLHLSLVGAANFLRAFTCTGLMIREIEIRHGVVVNKFQRNVLL